MNLITLKTILYSIYIISIITRYNINMSRRIRKIMPSFNPAALPSLQRLSARYSAPIFLMEYFLDPKLCDKLVSHPDADFKHSSTTDFSETIKHNINTEYRSSYTWNPCINIMAPIVSMAARLFTSIHPAQCETPQITRYHSGQQYKIHSDALHSHNRIITVIVYLNDVENGGHTKFPFASWNKSSAYYKQIKGEPGYSVSVKPKKGSAIIFFPEYVDSDDKEFYIDNGAMHIASPAIDDKYITQLWFRNIRYIPDV